MKNKDKKNAMKQIHFPTPSQKQLDFMMCNTRYLIYGGARGGGKSHIVRWLAILLALVFKGIKILIIRKTYSDLLMNHIRPMKQILRSGEKNNKDRIARYNGTEKTFYFPNGSTIEFQYFARDEHESNIRGGEWDVIAIDEATLLHEEWIKKIDACVRGANNFPHQLWLTANPGGPGHNYIRRLKNRQFLPEENPEDYTFIQALVTDNPALMEMDPNYIKTLEALPPKLRQAWLEGNWDIYEGQFFEEIRNDPEHYGDRRHTHVIPGFKPPHGWKIYMGYDWGYNKPFSAIWFYQDFDGVLYAALELYGCKKGEPNEGLKWTDDKQFAEIARIEREHPWLAGRKIHHIADPSIWSAAHTGLSTADVAWKYGIKFEKGNNERIAGWRQVHNRLDFDKEGFPRLYFFDNCPELLRTMLLMQYDENVPEDLATDGEDHAPDVVRYVCQSNPVKPHVELEERPPVFDPLDRKINRRN